MKLLHTLALASLASLVFAAPLHAQTPASSTEAPVATGPIAEVMAVRGEASVVRGALLRPLAAGDWLERGAELRTGANGRLRLRFVDGSTVVLGDRSQLKLERFEPAAGERPRETTLWLETGLIGQKVQPGGGWQVRTPTAVTAVRGTEFVVEVSAEQGTSVAVQSGEVVVEAIDMPRMRSTRPRPQVTLNQAQAGTHCRPRQGCSESAAWPPERLRLVQDRLGGV